MTKYPYPDTEAYPMTPARRAYIDKYNTRLVTAEVPSIDTVLTDVSVGASLRGRPVKAARGACSQHGAPPTEGRPYNSRPRK